MLPLSSFSAPCGVSLGKLNPNPRPFLQKVNGLTIDLSRCLRYCLRVPSSRLNHPLSRLPNLAQIPPKAVSNGSHHDLHWYNGGDYPHNVPLWQSMESLDNCIQTHHANAPHSLHVGAIMGNVVFLQNVPATMPHHREEGRQN